MARSLATSTGIATRVNESNRRTGLLIFKRGNIRREMKQERTGVAGLQGGGCDGRVMGGGK